MASNTASRRKSLNEGKYTSFPLPIPPSPAWSNTSSQQGKVGHSVIQLEIERSLALFQKEVYVGKPQVESVALADQPKSNGKIKAAQPTLGNSPKNLAPIDGGHIDTDAQVAHKLSDLTLENSREHISPEGSGYATRVSFSKQNNTFGPYSLLRTLGEGEFGKVKLAVHRESGHEVAIKLILKASLIDKVRKRKLQQEIAIFQIVHHPFIVKMHEVVETREHIAMIMEYASGGELFDHILSNKRLSDEQSCKYFAQLISGVSYLHANGIVHRDLKLENLLLDGNGNLCITDFGFAHANLHPDDPSAPRVAHADLETTWLTTSCGSPCYAAPELVVADRYIGPSADIWSCGVILYSMLAGYLPYDDDPNNPDGENISLLYRYILTTPLEVPSFINPLPRSLIESMLVADPSSRAKMRDIVAHPWLRPYAHLLDASASLHSKNRPAPPSAVESEFTPQPQPTPATSETSSLSDFNEDTTRINTPELPPGTSPRSKSLDLRPYGQHLIEGDDSVLSVEDLDRAPPVLRPTIDVPPFEYESLRRDVVQTPQQTKRKAFFSRKVHQIMQWLRTDWDDVSEPSALKPSVARAQQAAHPRQRPPEYFGDINPLCVMSSDDPFGLLLEMERTVCDMGFGVENVPNAWEMKVRVAPSQGHGTVQANYEFPPRKKGFFKRIWRGVFGSKASHDSANGESHELNSLHGSVQSSAKRPVAVTSHLKFTMQLMQLPGRNSLFYIRCKRHRGDPWEFQKVYGYIVQHLSKFISARRPVRSTPHA